MLKIKLIVILATAFAVSTLLYVLYSNKADYKANLKLDNNMIILEFDALSTTLNSIEDKIMFSQWDTSINVYSLKYNKIIFKTNTKDICYAKPLLENDLLYYPHSNKLFNCVDIITGNIKWQINIENRCSRSDIINDSIIILSIKGYGLKVINRIDGKLIYELKYNFNECLVPDASPWEIAYDDKYFYISNWQGSHLSCFKISDGSLNWNYKSTKSGISGQSICFKDKIFLEIDYFYKGGIIVIIDRTSGKVEFETNSSPLLFQTVPVFYDNEIYCYNYTLNKDKENNYFIKFNTDNYAAIKLFNLDNHGFLMGNAFYILNRNIYYSDGDERILYKYSIDKKELMKIGKLDMHLIHAHEYLSNIYLIMNIAQK